MAQQYPDDDQYGEYDAGHYDQHMEQRLVEALDFHVQDSVNRALVKALRPFAQPIFNFGVRRFGAGLGNLTPVEVNINEPGQSSYDPLDQTFNTVLSDHEYGAFRSHKTSSVQTTQNAMDESSSTDLDVTPTHDKLQGKHKREDDHAEESSIPPPSKNLQFDPDAIVHPRSMEWTPCQEVAGYIQSRLRKSFEKDVRNTLRSECPRPALSGKVVETPELHPHMVTFLKKYAKDQNISGPLKKNSDLAVLAMET
ncbi:hypothetical protein NDU88_002830 [Pleurodeles waltl]|uniref:Uncharacterized protein n=1 Tax=Pleurodeles waltl TaxID=8319 RepID=A0AAV7SDT8_PLEWA|nr:hypothetical protein NDU88_002830 [Pleurodeles waltl]